MPPCLPQSQDVASLVAWHQVLRAPGKITIVCPIERAGRRAMTQTTNRFFDEVARLMNDAAGVAQGVRREFETLVRAQRERILRALEEFEAVKEMARLAREENEALKARIDALESKGRKTKAAAEKPGPTAPDPGSTGK